jgi:predicted SprT family Zn-dependent metalloprotease
VAPYGTSLKDTKVSSSKVPFFRKKVTAREINLFQFRNHVLLVQFNKKNYAFIIQNPILLLFHPQTKMEYIKDQKEITRRDNFCKYNINELFKQYQLDGWKFGYDNAKTSAGMCRHRCKQITLSNYFVLNYKTTENDLLDTIKHEIAHAIVGGNHGHDRVWKAKALEVGCKNNDRCLKFRFAEGRWETFCPNQCWKPYRVHKRQRGLECEKCAQLCAYRIPQVVKLSKPAAATNPKQKRKMNTDSDDSSSSDSDSDNDLTMRELVAKYKKLKN